MQSATPVVIGLEPYERKIGGTEQGQPEYQPLHSLCSPDGKVMSRWELAPDERVAIASGADIFLTIWTSNQGYPPTQMQVLRADANADYFKLTMSLDDELELRMLAQDRHAAMQAFQERDLAYKSKCAEITRKLGGQEAAK